MRVHGKQGRAAGLGRRAGSLGPESHVFGPSQWSTNPLPSRGGQESETPAQCTSPVCPPRPLQASATPPRWSSPSSTSTTSSSWPGPSSTSSAALPSTCPGGAAATTGTPVRSPPPAWLRWPGRGIVPVPWDLGPRDALEVFQGHHGGLTPKIRARIHQHHRENVTGLFLKSNFTYLLFACAGSLLLRALFSRGEWWLLSSSSAWVSHCGGFSCWRAQALGTQASLAAAPGLGSFGFRAAEHRLCSRDTQA